MARHWELFLWTVISSVARSSSLNVVETGRCRRWSADEKLKSALQSFRHRAGLRRRRTIWIRAHCCSDAVVVLVRAEATNRLRNSELVPKLGWRLVQTGRPTAGAIEIEFVAGARMRIIGAVAAATLQVVVAALAEGRPR